MNERFICEKKRNHRKTLWKCKGESWFSLYTDVWKSPDGNEGRAYICVYEFEKVSKDKGKMGIAGGEKKQQDLYFEHNSFDKRKMALGCESKSHFVYGLSRTMDCSANVYSVTALFWNRAVKLRKPDR